MNVLKAKSHEDNQILKAHPQGYLPPLKELWYDSLDQR